MAIALKRPFNIRGGFIKRASKRVAEKMANRVFREPKNPVTPLPARETAILTLESRISAIETYIDRQERAIDPDAIIALLEEYQALNTEEGTDSPIMRPFFYQSCMRFLAYLEKAPVLTENMTRFFMFSPMHYKTQDTDGAAVSLHLGIPFAQWVMKAYPQAMHGELFQQHLRQLVRFDDIQRHTDLLYAFLQTPESHPQNLNDSVVYALIRAVRHADDTLLDHIVAKDVHVITPVLLDAAHYELSGGQPLSALVAREEDVYTNLMQRSVGLRTILMRYGLIESGFHPENKLIKLTLQQYMADITLNDLAYARDAIINSDAHDVKLKNLNKVLAVIVKYRPDLATGMAEWALEASESTPSDPLFKTMAETYPHAFTDAMLYAHYEKVTGHTDYLSIETLPLNMVFAIIANHADKIPPTLATLATLNARQSTRDYLFGAVIARDPASITHDMVTRILGIDVLEEDDILHRQFVDMNMAKLVRRTPHLNELLASYAMNMCRFQEHGELLSALLTNDKDALSPSLIEAVHMRAANRKEAQSLIAAYKRILARKPELADFFKTLNFRHVPIDIEPEQPMDETPKRRRDFGIAAKGVTAIKQYYRKARSFLSGFSFRR